MNKSTSRILLSLSVATASTLLALPPSSAIAAETTLEEIVVTAQKREQNLQDTVISITAFSETTLEKLNISDLENVSHFTPNLRITSVASDATTASVAMRGTFNRNPTDPSSENTVGLYRDGVYIGKSNGALMELGDLERIEVLRGPQGTLYGKNTIGGAINLVSKRPGDEFGGWLRVGAGNEGLIYTKGGIDLPAVGTAGEGMGQLRSRVSFLTRQRDGLVKNVPSDAGGSLANPIDGASEFGNIDRWAAGIILDWQLNEDLTLGYSYDKSDIDQKGVYTQATYIGPGNFIFLTPYANAKRQDKGSLDYKNSFDKAKIDGHALTVDWRVGEFGGLGDITIKSITAKRSVDSSAGYDLDGSNVSALHFTRSNDYDQFSQELQFLQSSTTVNSVVGLYYFQEEADYGGPSQVFGAFGQPERDASTKFDNDTKAIYGQVEWEPAALDRLTLTLGGRYSDEHKETWRFVSNGDAIIIPRQKLPDLDFSENTYLASAGWALSNDVNIYIKYSEGYRSGSYDGQSRDPAAFDEPTDLEYLTSWEAGLKSRWMNDRVQLNVAVFTSDYEDMLISAWDPDNATTRTQNAGEGTIEGLEVEFIGQVTDSMRITAFYGYLDGKWDSYPGLDASGQPTDLKNIAAFPMTPRDNYGIGLDYDFPSLGFGELSFHVDYSYTDPLYIVPLAANGLSAPIIQARIEDREAWNARLLMAGIEMGGTTLEFALWGKNLGDEDVERSKFDAGDAVFSEWDDPLTYGAEFTVRF